MKTEPEEPMDSVFIGEPRPPSPTGSLFATNLPVDTYTLRPMTVKMLTDGFCAAPDEWRITVDGQPVSSVRLVGRMYNKAWSDDALTFKLGDGTGGVDVIYWFEDSLDLDQLGKINNGDYVTIVGIPMSNSGYMRIKAYVVRGITNYNDVTHHSLMCIYTHLDALKTNAQKARDAAKASASSSTVRSVVPITPGTVLDHGSTEEKIMGILRDPAYRDIEHGVSFNLLGRLIGVSPMEITRATEVMLDMGTIFTTVSDHHVKSSLE